MFEQLRDLKKAQEMQKAFAQEKHTVEKDGIKVTVNGNMRIEEIVIGQGVDADRIGPDLTALINQAFQEIQYKLAKNLMG